MRTATTGSAPTRQIYLQPNNTLGTAQRPIVRVSANANIIHSSRRVFGISPSLLYNIITVIVVRIRIICILLECSVVQ